MKEIMLEIYFARFTTVDELYARKEEIRKVVQEYDYDTLEIYKWYFFFQLCLLKNPLKELLWNYLAKETLSAEEETNLSTEYRKYKERCMQILQYHKKKDEEKESFAQKKEIKTTITINSVEDLFKI